jgi:CO/xanthine dehydrogenase FAD-binding subunit
MGGLHPKNYFKPETSAEVASILHRYKEDALIIGGGTEVYELSERGLLTNIKAVVDLSKLGLNQIRVKDGEAAIGASVTLSQLENQIELYKDGALGCLLDALRDLGPLQVRNMATVAGAVTACIPFFDLPVALACLNTIIEVEGDGGTRRVPILSFQKDYLQPDLNEGEFVTGLVIPKQEPGTKSAFTKFVLNAGDWSIVNCAAAIRVSRRKVASARVVIGAVANKPFVANQTASSLVGTELDDSALESAGNVLQRELLDPPSDSKASGFYRKRLAKILLKETLQKAISRGGDE